MRNYFFYSLLILVFFCCSSKQEKSQSTLVEAPLSLEDTLILSMAADLYRNTERFSEALNEYDKLLEIDSINGKYLYRKAYCLGHLNRPIESIYYFKKAADHNYYTFDCFYAIGLNALILKDDSLAIEYFEKCRSMNPNSKEVLVFLKHLKGIDKTLSL